VSLNYKKMENTNDNRKNWPSDSELRQRQVKPTNEAAHNGRNDGYDAIGDEREKLMFAGRRYRDNQNENEPETDDGSIGE
jgi:hypothetical protein